MKKHFFLAAILPLTTLFTINAQAQATDEEITEDSVAHMQRLAKTIEATPNDLAAHEAYLKASGFTKGGSHISENIAKEIVAQYETWMKKFPKSATVAYALGHAFEKKESPKARPYLLKAVEIDPKFDKAYFDLWIDAERWGNKTAVEYLLKAKNAAPQNASYAYHYACSFSKTDYEKFKKLSLQVAKDFPKTETGAQVLYVLCLYTKDKKAKIELYEQLKKEFPADQFNYTGYGMFAYFELLVEHEPLRALALARYMLDLKGKDEESAKTWQENIDMVKNLMEANALLKDNKVAEALAIAEKMVVPRYSSIKEHILLFKSTVLDAAGKTDEAYKAVLTEFVKEPTAKLKEQAISFGKKLGKDKMTVENEVWSVREKSSGQAPDFSLANYYTKTVSSLSDYKGKVVLLTYWFPGCGPCRSEFPHFENVVKKFKGKDFVYLGINVLEAQNDYVLPFMKSTGYSFIPLLDNNKWKKGPLNNYGVAPVNFLIDGNGKVIFSHFRTDAQNEATLEMMISSMLERKK